MSDSVNKFFSYKNTSAKSIPHLSYKSDNYELFLHIIFAFFKILISLYIISKIIYHDRKYFPYLLKYYYHMYKNFYTFDDVITDLI